LGREQATVGVLRSTGRDSVLGLEVDPEAIRQFCLRHGIRELALFGSAVRGELRPDSDLDVLVEFEPGRTPSIFRFLDLQAELSALFGRTVDLVSKHGLNPNRRDRILTERQVLYAPPG
jgi:predicted nucleotidyltransferase